MDRRSSGNVIVTENGKKRVGSLSTQAAWLFAVSVYMVQFALADGIKRIVGA
jgi:hypothetical protein